MHPKGCVILMATLYHQVWTTAPLSRIYEALATADGVANWWGPHTSTDTPDGLVLAHDAGPQHGEVQMLVVDSIPNERVEWEVISKHPSASPASAWTGTRISFEMSERPNPGMLRGIEDPRPTMSVIEFRHSGWDERSEFFGFCNFAWGETLLGLKSWCEGG
jgi:uncharacterized protein YndB with AHSA1/START domain